MYIYICICIWVYLSLHIHIYLTCTCSPSRLFTLVTIPIWVCHHGPHFHPAQRAGRCNICSKPNWSIKNLPKTRQNTRSQLRGHLTKVRYPSCQGIWICFTFPACRVHVCMLLCMFRVDTTMKIDEIHCTIGRCSPVHLKFPVGGS